jgi:hypothetical protein
MKQSDIIKMIEAFYDTQLTDDQIVKLPTQEHEITPASMRHYLEQHADSLPRLIDFLRLLPTVMKAHAMAANRQLSASPQPQVQTGLPPQQKNMSVFDYIRL